MVICVCVCVCVCVWSSITLCTNGVSNGDDNQEHGTALTHFYCHIIRNGFTATAEGSEDPGLMKKQGMRSSQGL